MPEIQSENSTTGRIKNDKPLHDMTFVIDTRTGERGTAEDWVAVFMHVWRAPADRLDRLLGLLDENVVLRAPTVPPVLKGRKACRAGFRRTFAGLPDLVAEVRHWSYTDGILYIDIRFSATIGGRQVSWPSIDRIRFSDGVAMERTAYFDPAPIRRAFLRSVKGLRQYWRLRHSSGEEA